MARLSKRQQALVLSALFLSISMMGVVPFVTRTLGALPGYLCVFAIYWSCFCVPAALLFGQGQLRVGLRLKGQPIWIPALAIALPIGVFFGAQTLNSVGSDPILLVLAVGCALLNGPLEELAWRRTFRANSGGNLSFELLGLFLFTLWHVPLYFSQGVAFDHGALGLIGGGLLLGAVWMVMTRESNAIGWPIISHTLVNVAGFIPLFTMNFGS